ncbi:MAG: DUF1549 and DUF1553 domain-containing protein [Pirellulales bacterium]|nr:DUF1549 and DUF1553 domain-containing protein [Pirellulales bacterium]
MSAGDNGQHEDHAANGQERKPSEELAAPAGRSSLEDAQAEVLAQQAERLFLNACLEEVLGNETPPDLAPEILARLAQADLASSSINGSNGYVPAVEKALLSFNGNGDSRLSQPPISTISGNGTSSNGVSGNGVAAEPSSSAQRSSEEVSRSRESKRGWLITITATTACLLLAFVTYLNWQAVFGDRGNETVHSATDDTSQPSRTSDADQRIATDSPTDNRGSGNAESSASDTPGSTRLANGNQSLDTVNPDNDALPLDAGGTPSLTRPVEAIVAQINSRIEERWQEESITPADWATDAEWCRRVFLDVLGRIPTVEESVDYVTSSDAAKKQQLVSSLLYGEEYRDEFSDHWAGVWTNVLIGREGGTQPRGIVSREGLHSYLASAFEQDKSYDGIVTDLITATGANRPGAADFNGAVNFLLDNMDHDAVSATAKTSQIFLARQVQCAQCHNHPFYEQPQRQFWEMNAFFRQTRVVRPRGGSAGRRNGVARLMDRDFAGQGNRRNADEADIYYERANGLLEVAFPRFLDGTSINPSGRLAVVNRRQELADMIVKSPAMAEAIVNRTWGYFLGSGFSLPVDDLGPHQSVSHPDLLDDLAADFREQGHDLRRLMQSIVLSRPYAISSEAANPASSGDERIGAGGPLFSRFYSRQLPPEAVFDSLLVAAGRHRSGNATAQNRARRLWLGQFTIELENDENREVDLFDGAIPQTLEMWNGAMTSQALSLKDKGLLASIANSNMPNPDKIKHLFLAALSREPTDAEMRLVGTMLRDSSEAEIPPLLQDVYWSLLNSSEFILQH